MRKLLFLLLPLLLLSGCWDRVEINDRLCVRSIGLDPGSKAGLMRVTFQVMQPQENGMEADPVYQSFTVEAPTFAKAADLFAAQAQGKPHYEHVAAVILGEKAARTMEPAWLDYFYRAPLFRRNSQWAVVSSSAEALLTGPLAQASPGEAMEEIIRTYDTRGRSTVLVSSMYRLFVHRVNGETFALLHFSYQEPEESENLLPAQFLQVDGASVWGESGYLGQLSREEWEDMRLLCGFQEGGVITLARVGEFSGPFTFKLTESRSRLKYHTDDESPCFVLHFDASFSLVEAVGDTGDGFFDAAEGALQEALQEKLDALTEKERLLNAELMGAMALLRQRGSCTLEDCLAMEMRLKAHIILDKSSHESE